jgi:hypothetical protein
MLRRFALVVSLWLVTGCAEPPSKEMHQAQGAIDAARAAGADEYAADEFKGAVDALAQADVAVAARDYRLALAHALDSRERAQSAAKSAVDARARARGDAERALAEATALVDRTDLRLKQPEVAKLPRRVLTPVQSAMTTAQRSLQEARAALEQEDYARIREVTAEVSREIKAALVQLDAAAPPPARARKR